MWRFRSDSSCQMFLVAAVAAVAVVAVAVVAVAVVAVAVAEAHFCMR